MKKFSHDTKTRREFRVYGVCFSKNLVGLHWVRSFFIDIDDWMSFARNTARWMTQLRVSLFWKLKIKEALSVTYWMLSTPSLIIFYTFVWKWKIVFKLICNLNSYSYSRMVFVIISKERNVIPRRCILSLDQSFHRQSATVAIKFVWFFPLTFCHTFGPQNLGIRVFLAPYIPQ